MEQPLSPDQKLEARTDGTSTPPPSEQASPPKISTPTTGFGSHLERNERVAMMRARSSSLSESQSSNLQQQTSPVQEQISSLAMTPEERRALETEMRAQHTHPLTMRLEQEEAERRMRNEMAYYQNRSNSNRRTIADVRRQAAGRPPPGRDWNRIVDAFERTGGETAVNSNNARQLDDLVVLEAAIMLSMDEEARRRGEPPPPRPPGSSRTSQYYVDRSAGLTRNPLARGGGLTEEQQLAMAIAASLQESSVSGMNNNNNNNNQEEDNDNDDEQENQNSEE